MHNDVQRALKGFKAGTVSADDVLKIISARSVEDLGFANVDHQRAARQGFPEVIFCLNKTPAQVAAIAARLAAHGNPILATKASSAQFRAVKKKLPRAVFHDDAGVITVAPAKRAGRHSTYYAAVVTAGTSDIPVAREAALTIESFGYRAETVFDVGVAGIHRLLKRTPILTGASVIIVAAGMEGALPSVVGGLVAVPVIAVPTSVGYGASFGGVAALLGMLNSCSSNVTVVNIDNGFGAGFVASTFLRQLHAR